MDVATIEMTREEAREKHREHKRRRVPRDNRRFYKQERMIYWYLAEGFTLIDVSRAIRESPVDNAGRPKLAIAATAADRVDFVWERGSNFARFNSVTGKAGRIDTREVMMRRKNSSEMLLSRDTREVIGREHAEIVQAMGLGIERKLARSRRPAMPAAPASVGVEAFARVPHLPLRVRPEAGRLSDWHTLFEVERWESRPAEAVDSPDPFLLKHVAGDVFVKLAEWDLTPLERVMAREANVA
ncbi:MAG: hypothetical protein AAF532_03640 [Planctomycetota bacterium]